MGATTSIVRKARVTSKGQITVPKAVRERLGIQPGDELAFQIHGAHVEVVPTHRRRVADFAGLFRVRRAVPAAAARTRGWAMETRRLVAGRRAAR